MVLYKCLHDFVNYRILFLREKSWTGWTCLIFVLYLWNSRWTSWSKLVDLSCLSSSLSVRLCYVHALGWSDRRQFRIVSTTYTISTYEQEKRTYRSEWASSSGSEEFPSRHFVRWMDNMDRTNVLVTNNTLQYFSFVFTTITSTFIINCDSSTLDIITLWTSIWFYIGRIKNSNYPQFSCILVSRYLRAKNY